MVSYVTLPDVVSQEKTTTPSPLQWVGMEGIAVPLNIKSSDGVNVAFPSTADIYVSLDNIESKGIHMSRLHLLLNKLAETPINDRSLESILNEMIESQLGGSNNAKLHLAFDFLLTKPSLLSGERGYQAYPVVVRAQKVEGEFKIELDLTIAYSSTCPCSASLSRHAYRNTIEQQFPTSIINKEQLLTWLESAQGSVATPHSQRSFAYIKLALREFDLSLVSRLVNQFEEIIGTPVQTAVKRQDEQEFARLNGENLMFCEDAARKIKQGLEHLNGVYDYWFKVEHQESLHAHNAVVIDQKYSGITTE